MWNKNKKYKYFHSDDGDEVFCCVRDDFLIMKALSVGYFVNFFFLSW